MEPMPTDLALTRRTGLPESLRVLVAEFPREGWQAHPHFSGLVQFWLERHMMFRKLTAMLSADNEALLAGRQDPREHAQRLSRFGGMLLDQLHGHHMIEDQQYFPMLQGLDGRLARGFDLLEQDHAAMDGLLHDFATGANGVIAAADDGKRREAAAAHRKGMTHFNRLLDRHLNDEEEIVVPVILAYEGRLG